MELLKFIPLYVVTVTMVEGRQLLPSKGHRSQEEVVNVKKDSWKGLSMCLRLAEEPYFGVDMLLGHAWTICHTWNMNLHNRCMHMTFRNATRSIVNRFYDDMNEYLETEPNWNGASVLVSMGHAGHELLLFPHQGSSGKFQAVPNYIRDGIKLLKSSVPLLKFHLKLMYGGKYLVMADCRVGVMTMLISKGNLPCRAEVASIASTLNFGDGLRTCRYL